jgi:hypothetical protein
MYSEFKNKTFHSSILSVVKAGGESGRVEKQLLRAGGESGRAEKQLLRTGGESGRVEKQLLRAGGESGRVEKQLLHPIRFVSVAQSRANGKNSRGAARVFP